MTNKISKAREALDDLFRDKNPYFNVAHHLQARFLSGHKDTILHILTTLSSIDAERLGEAIAIRTGQRGDLTAHAKRITEFYKKYHLEPEDVVNEAAATLHGLVGGGVTCQNTQLHCS